MQKTWYYDIYKTCIEAGVKIVSIWLIADNLDPGWRYNEQCSPFDNSYGAKPAYYGIQSALLDTRPDLTNIPPIVSFAQPDANGVSTRLVKVYSLDGKRLSNGHGNNAYVNSRSGVLIYDRGDGRIKVRTGYLDRH